MSQHCLLYKAPFIRCIIFLHSPIKDKEVEVFLRWSFCFCLQMTGRFLRAMLMWPDYTSVCAREAASTTYAKCKRGLTHVFLGAYSSLNEIAACGKVFAVPESTDVCGWGRWGVGECSTQIRACVWVWEIVTADRMIWLGTFQSLFGVHECILSGQMLCMWSFKAYRKAAYMAMHTSKNLWGTSKHGLTLALSPYIPLVLASMGGTDASCDKFLLGK